MASNEYGVNLEERKELIRILSEVDLACKEIGVSYWLSCGTLLGAIRHNGFIPWDDDVDICMLRGDYEKFLLQAENVLPRHLKLITCRNTRRYGNLFCKVQEIRSSVYNSVSSGGEYTNPQGIYVDIFPMDYYPSSPWARLLFKVRMYLAYSCASHIMHKGRHTSFKGRWVGGACRLLAGFWFGKYQSQNDFAIYFEHLLFRYCHEASKEVFRFNPTLAVIGKELHVPTSAFETVYHRFEGMEFPVPRGWNEYLTACYGKDYMNLPPASQRKPQHMADGDALWMAECICG